MGAPKNAILLSAIFTSTVVMALSSAAADQHRMDSAHIIDDIAACSSVSDAAARLACFDRAVEALEKARAANDLVVVDREQIRKSKRSLFGFTLPNLHLFGRDDRDEAEDIKQVDATIQSVRDIGNDHWRLTMVDGAMWETTEGVAFPPKIGQVIHIKAGVLGSYFASIAGARGFKVKRVR